MRAQRKTTSCFVEAKNWCVEKFGEDRSPQLYTKKKRRKLCRTVDGLKVSLYRLVHLT